MRTSIHILSLIKSFNDEKGFKPNKHQLSQYSDISYVTIHKHMKRLKQSKLIKVSKKGSYEVFHVK